MGLLILNSYLVLADLSCLCSCSCGQILAMASLDQLLGLAHEAPAGRGEDREHQHRGEDQAHQQAGAARPRAACPTRSPSQL